MTTLQNKEGKVKSESISKKKSAAFSVVTSATKTTIDLYGGEENEKLEGPIVMGLHDKNIVLWSRRQNALIEVTMSEVKADTVLQAFCGKSWLTRYFLKIDPRTGDTGINHKAASLEIAGTAGSLRHFSTSNCYSTGCWSDKEGRLVINSADFCVDNTGKDVERIDLSRKRAAIYTTQSKYSMPAYVAESDKDVDVTKKVLEDLSTWKFVYESEIGVAITVGWIVSAIYCAALETRPSIWITGEAGAGKSKLFHYISSLLGESALSVERASSAAIRQSIRDSSVPVLLDEFETTGTDQKVGATVSILQSMRAAYTSKNATIKGTSNQSGMQYREMYPFAFFSVSSPALESADAGRIVRLRMQPADHDGKDAPIATEEDRAQFMWSIWRRWDLYKEILSAVKKEYKVQEPTKADDRERDSYCTVVAGAVLVYSIKKSLTRVEDLSKNIKDMVSATLKDMVEEIEVAREQRKDYESVYKLITETKIRVECIQYNGSGSESTRVDTMTIGEAIEKAEDHDEDADHALRMIGIRAGFKKDDLSYTAIALQNIELSRLLANTRWRANGSWAEPLKSTPCCIKGQTVRFTSTPAKAVLIPSNTRE
ncbi:MAG: hypothetical protein ACYDD9_06190 [Acidithiobacillus sp.]